MRVIPSTTFTWTPLLTAKDASDGEEGDTAAPSHNEEEGSSEPPAFPAWSAEQAPKEIAKINNK